MSAPFCAAVLAGAALLSNLGTGEVARFETAEEQLAHATTLRRRQRAATGEAQRAAREAAVEAYEAVFAYHPKARGLAADAFFRAGELQRAAGELHDALRLFEQAAKHSDASPLRERALLETGHVHRRLGAHKNALVTLELIILDTKAAPKYRDRALFWKARVLFAMHEEDEARRALRALASASKDPLMWIRAYDELALSAVREGDLEWAAGLIDRCRVAIAGRLKEETNVGRKVRNAFRHMRCRARLKEAITARRRTKTH